MAVVGVGLTYLFISTLMHHVLVDSTCLPKECLSCSSSVAGSCLPCNNNSFCEVSKNCPLQNFTVLLKATTFTVDEGTELNVTCSNTLPQNLDISFEWTRDDEVLQDQNRSVLILKIKGLTTLTCTALSLCGNFTSPSQDVSINDQTGIVLLICGVSAVAIIILLAIIMKIMIKRSKAQREARKRQRQANMQNISGTTITGYW